MDLVSDLVSRLSSLPYFQQSQQPNLDADYLVFDLGSESGANEASKRYRISTRSKGSSNLLFVHRDARQLKAESLFEFKGADNAVIIGERCGFCGSLTFEGSNNLVTLLGGQGMLGLGATLYSGDALVIGRGTIAWGIRVWVQGGTVCTIGDDGLLSEGIQIRTTDHHSIIDLNTWTQSNHPADVAIGRHVWVGTNCIITKGTKIGDGAIIAPAALVSGIIPRTELWGGVPARMIRSNVSWVASHPTADPIEIERLRDIVT